MYNTKLYNTVYHSQNLSEYRFLVTGGAGFIGSNLVEYLLRNGAGHVRVLDNLSNGYIENIQAFSELPNFEFMEGDIRDYDVCTRALEGIHFVSHQAALGSVPRSISDPVATNAVNISGFLNILQAAKNSKTLKRMIYAASSSTYGDSKLLPKIEGNEGNPLSPYAVTKLVNELYADVFSKVYNFHTIGLRYFNIFGPKQNPNNPYAAVVPIFCKHFLDNTQPTIFGDGITSRDFTFVENAVQANILAFFHGLPDLDPKNTALEKHEVYNVACGDQISLNEMVEVLNTITGKKIEALYGAERQGDVKHSKASIDKISSGLHYNPKYKFQEGLSIVYDWYAENTTL